MANVLFVHVPGFSFGDYADSHVVIPMGLAAHTPNAWSARNDDGKK